MPTGIAIDTMGGSLLTAEVHPSAGGGAFTDQCMGNGVLIGFDGSKDSSPTSTSPWLKSATPHCGTPTLSGTGPFTVTIPAAEDLPLRGSMSDMAQVARCPADYVIVSFNGNNGTYIDSLSFNCAKLVVTGDATNGYTLSIDTNSIMLVGPIGGTGGASFGETPCPGPGQVTVGVSVHSGAWFDGFGMICGIPSLTGMVR
jgi:hypothetical protein